MFGVARCMVRVAYFLVAVAQGMLNRLLAPTHCALLCGSQLWCSQAFVQVRHHKFGQSHPETISYAEQLALACAAIAVLHVALPDGKLHEARLALELINNTLDEYSLSPDAARQLRMLALEVDMLVCTYMPFQDYISALSGRASLSLYSWCVAIGLTGLALQICAGIAYREEQWAVAQAHCVQLLAAAGDCRCVLQFDNDSRLLLQRAQVGVIH